MSTFEDITVPTGLVSVYDVPANSCGTLLPKDAISSNTVVGVPWEYVIAKPPEPVGYWIIKNIGYWYGVGGDLTWDVYNKIPKWFHRKMVKLFFGIEWKNKDDV